MALLDTLSELFSLVVCVIDNYVYYDFRAICSNHNSDIFECRLQSKHAWRWVVDIAASYNTLIYCNYM